MNSSTWFMATPRKLRTLGDISSGCVFYRIVYSVHVCDCICMIRCSCVCPAPEQRQKISVHWLAVETMLNMMRMPLAPIDIDVYRQRC
jgi:hypothetical protein